MLITNLIINPWHRPNSLCKCGHVRLDGGSGVKCLIMAALLLCSYEPCKLIRPDMSFMDLGENEDVCRVNQFALLFTISKCTKDFFFSFFLFSTSAHSPPSSAITSLILCKYILLVTLCDDYEPQNSSSV